MLALQPLINLPMESKSKIIEPLLQDFSDLIVTSISLTKYKVIKQVSDIGSTLIYYFVLFSLFGMMFLFLACACSFFLGQLLGSNAYGFLVVSGVFALLMIVLFLFKKRLYLFFYQRMVQSLLP